MRPASADGGNFIIHYVNVGIVITSTLTAVVVAYLFLPFFAVTTVGLTPNVLKAYFPFRRRRGLFVDR